MTTPMPWSVRIAAAALVFTILALATLLVVLGRGGGVPVAQTVLAAAVFGAVLAGVVRGKRLAWQWGRALGFVLSALVLAGAAMAAFRVLPRHAIAEDGAAAFAQGAHLFLPLLVPVLGLGVPLLVAAIALGRPSAYAWFGLRCPHCGANVPRALDLRFRAARCRKCGEEY